MPGIRLYDNYGAAYQLDLQVSQPQMEQIMHGILAVLDNRILPEVRVSDARWCDYRDHPFKGGQEGTITMGQIVNGPNGGKQYKDNEMKEVCPECAAELGMNPDYKAPEPPAVRKELLTKAVRKYA
jgi:hypothetical protein